MNEELIEVKTLPVITKFIYTIGQLPSSYMMSMTYEEQVVWLCNYLEKEVIPALNNNGQAVQELQHLYELLKEYVDSYFENLDVQEEINNKLDEMVEDGTLNEIINQEIFGQINSDISNLYEYTDLKNKPTLFIGDSYVNATYNYAEYYKSFVGLDNSKFFRYASNGAGFYATGSGGKTFEDVLDDAIAGMTSTQKESIKLIIVGSCLNDPNYNASTANITAGINSFMEKANTNFPNALVKIIACGYRLGTTTDIANIRARIDNMLIPTLLNCNTNYNNPIFIDNSYLWLRNSDWFNDDNTHPNQTGQQMIARHLIRALNGNTEIRYHGEDITVTVPDQNETNPNETFTINVDIINSNVVLRLGSNTRLYNITSLTSKSNFKIGTWDCKVLHFGSAMSGVIPVMLRVAISSVNDQFVPADLKFAANGDVQLFVHNVNNFDSIINFTIYPFTSNQVMYLK